jgi:hypothetical protein
MDAACRRKCHDGWHCGVHPVQAGPDHGGRTHVGPNDVVADFLTSAHTESLKLSEAINNVKTAGFLQQVGVPSGLLLPPPE